MRDVRPNIVLVVLDSVRRDHLSCYGHVLRTTPNIDELAERSLVFERAYAASCWTVPSHASMFTGLYPSVHRADQDTMRLTSEHETIAEVLTRAGYQAACITCNGFVTDRTNLAAGFDLVSDIEAIAAGSGAVGRVVRRTRKLLRSRIRRDRGAARAARAASEWVRKREVGRPYFLFVNLMECHLPYGLKSPDILKFVPTELHAAALQLHQDPFAAIAGKATYTDEEVSLLKLLYDGCLHYMDNKVGEILETIWQQGEGENTIVVVTSDHGESFGEHGLFDHQYGLFEHLISVPLIVFVPGQDSRRLSGLIQHTDLAQVLKAAATNGNGLSDALLGISREHVFAEYLVANTRAIRRRFPHFDLGRLSLGQRSIVKKCHKVIQWEDGALRLFDLEADPQERVDIARREPALAERLANEMEDELGPWPTRGGSGAQVDVDDAMRERLQQLGYL